MGGLYKYLEENQLNHTYDGNEIGVLPDFVCTPDVGPKQSQILFGLSSKNLMQQMIFQATSRMVCFIDVDGTYSLTSHEYPTIVVGTVDANHKFHLVALFISQLEDADAYFKAFEGLRKAFREIFNFDLQVEEAMLDSSGAPGKALSKVWPNVKLGVCRFHMKKAVKKNFKKFRSVRTYELFCQDLDLCHSIGSN